MHLERAFTEHILTCWKTGHTSLHTPPEDPDPTPRHLTLVT
jgi:hypothetical protein